MKAWLAGLGAVAAAGLTGCAVYPAPVDAGVTVGVGAPVYVAPRPYYYGYPYRGYYGGGDGYWHERGHDRGHGRGHDRGHDGGHWR